MKRFIIIFLKFPEPGKVKTRLARDLGEETACQIYDQLVGKVTANLPIYAKNEKNAKNELTNNSTISAHKSESKPESEPESNSRKKSENSLSLLFCFSPAEKKHEVQKWITDKLASKKIAPDIKIHFEPQTNGNLGNRLKQAFSSVFEKHNADTAAVIGTDCIDIPADFFYETWQVLEPNKTQHDLVIGPTKDGGYYLLAISNFKNNSANNLIKKLKTLFEQIPWSSTSTLSTTLQRAQKQQMQIKILPKLNDIDDINDLKQNNSLKNNWHY